MYTLCMHKKRQHQVLNPLVKRPELGCGGASPHLFQAVLPAEKCSLDLGKQPLGSALLELIRNKLLPGAAAL